MTTRPDTMQSTRWNDASSDSDESGSSYVGSGNSSDRDSAVRPYPANQGLPAYASPRGGRPCEFRTAEFHDQECSRYFDCPSHLVERSLDHDDTRAAVAANQDESEDGSDNNVAGPSQSRDQPGEAARGGGDGSASFRPPTSPSALLNLPLRSGDEQAVSSGGDNHGNAMSLRTQAPLPPLPSAARRSSTEAGSDNEGEGSRRAAVRNPPLRISSRAQPVPPTPASSSRAGPSGSNAPLPPTPTSAQYQHRPDASALTSPSRTTETSTPVRSAGPVDIVLPRWQPDSEVTLCPICHTQFSIWVRKHHCRKCGRVVCNSCSPHRITIPYQYIVRPPGQAARLSQLYANPAFGVDSDAFRGGGERVRLCNPCVPDPNTTPPHPLGSPSNRNQYSPRPHYRSQSTVSGSGYQGHFGGLSAPDHSRSRSSTLHVGTSSASSSRSPYAGNTESRILSGTPPAHLFHTSPYRSNYGGASSSSSSSAARRPMPPVPPGPPQIAEEDECPVCHRELPPRTLPNVEALREAHINICITSHSTYSGGGAVAAGVGGVGGGSATDDPSSPLPLSARRTGMFPYRATEKDCIDSAECTICLEEFEVGVEMARLECLCRFHRSCISAWFVNHPGRCPVHQHDSYGF